MTGETSASALPRQPWAAVPSELADMIRPHLDEVADDMIQEIQSRVSEYSPPGEGPYSATLRFAVEQVLQYFVDRIDAPETGRPGQLPETPSSHEAVTDFFRAIGRGEAGEGRSLDAMQAAMRVGGLISWRRISEGAITLNIDSATLAALGESLLIFMDELAEAAAEGHAQASSAAAGEMQRRRKRLLDLLLSNPPASTEAIEDLAAAAQWQLPRTVAAVALGGEHGDARLPALPPDILVDLGGRQPALIVPDPDGPGRGRLIDRALGDCLATIGPTVRLTEAARSMQWARQTLLLAQRGVIKKTGVVRCVEHISTLIVFQDQDLLESLTGLRLAPLAHLRASQQDRLAETLLAWLQSGRNANEVAVRLHIHPQTVRYRLRQLEDLFGDQLLDSDLRFDLEIVLRARHLLIGHGGMDVTGSSKALAAGEVVTLRR